MKLEKPSMQPLIQSLIEAGITPDLPEKFIAGPWLCVMGRDENGSTHYSVLTHSHTSVAVLHDGSYWLTSYTPSTDEDGYYLPDDQMDCLPCRVATARLIAAAPDLLAVAEKTKPALEAVADTAAEVGFDQLADLIDTILTETKHAIAKARGQ